jgi:hypothetical protein
MVTLAAPTQFSYLLTLAAPEGDVFVFGDDEPQQSVQNRPGGVETHLVTQSPRPVGALDYRNPLLLAHFGRQNEADRIVLVVAQVMDCGSQSAPFDVAIHVHMEAHTPRQVDHNETWTLAFQLAQRWSLRSQITEH